MLKSELLSEIDKITAKEKLSNDDIFFLMDYIEMLKAIKDSEINDVFPVLREYRKNHTIGNLTKLCNEIFDFCVEVYASTRSDEEREVYKKMVEKLYHK